MKAAIISILIVAVAIGFLQREKLNALHASEQRVSVALRSESPSDSSPRTSTEPRQTAPPLSNEELVKFTNRIMTLRARLANEQGNIAGWPTAEDDPELCAILSRLTSQQLREIIEHWERAQKDEKKKIRMGIDRLINLAAQMNPRATLDAIFELAEQRGEEGAVGDAAISLKEWFDQNPAELLRWARERQAPYPHKETFATWKAAAAALLETTPETVAELVAHSDPPKDWPKQFSAEDILRKLKTYESRLAFLRCLHAATGGTTTGWILNQYAHAMSDHIPFDQAAMLADSLPEFRPVNESMKSIYESGTVYFGSLRYAIAEVYRDGTVAARWNWLVSRPEDRPHGKKLEYLISEWCKRSYGDGNKSYNEVAQWVRGLPLGAERTEVRQAILAFCKEDLRKPDIVAEWESP